MDGQEKRSSSYLSSVDTVSMHYIRPDLLGYVFHLAWMLLLLYTPGAVPGIDDGRVDDGGSPLASVVYLSSVAALVATLALGIARPHAFMRAVQARPARLAAPLAMSLGTVAYCAYGLAPVTALVVAGGMLTGAGSAVMAARWAAAFGNAEPRAVVNTVPYALLAISALAITLKYAPPVVTLALLVALPLLSGACLEYARRYQRSRGVAGRTGPAEGTPRGSRASTRRRYAALVAGVALLGLCAGSLSAFETPGAGAALYDVAFNVTAAVSVMVFVGVSIWSNDRAWFVPGFVAPVAMLGMVLVPYVQFVAGDLVLALYPVGSIAFELMFLFTMVLYALWSGFSPARTFMVGRAALAVSNLVGSWAASLLVGGADSAMGLQAGSVLLFAASEVLVVGIVLGYLMGKRGRLAGRWADRGAASVPDPAETSTAAPGSGQTPEARDRCVELAGACGLSERELDVLRLLAAGKDSAAVRDELGIAQGTVNYHTRNVYAKLGVHSRQELMLLVLGGRP